MPEPRLPTPYWMTPVTGIAHLGNTILHRIVAFGQFARFVGATWRGLSAFKTWGRRDRLCVEFVRRKNSTNPGIAYTVLFGSSLIDWTPGGAQVSAVSIDSIWERVRYEDTITASQAPARFCQVTVRSQ